MSELENSFPERLIVADGIASVSSLGIEFDCGSDGYWMLAASTVDKLVDTWLGGNVTQHCIVGLLAEMEGDRTD